MKIGFLAMSGVRACDAELLELGLTLPGFVERSKQVASLPSLGLLLLAGATPAGHELRYAEADREGVEPAWLEACDLVAISTFTAQVREAYRIADRLRAAGVQVAMGGLHVSALPEEALEHADWVVVGEGENVWPELVRRVALGERGGLLRASDFEPVRIAELPVPRYDLLEDRAYNRFTLQTTRGCPWRCEFCASTVMLGEPYRKRPVAQVMRDLRALRAVRREPFLEFADDNTFVDPSWGRELCDALRPEGLHWFTETDLSIADHPALLDAMARSGCRQVLIGLEATDAAVLGGVERNGDFKARRVSDQIDAIRRIQARGITVNGCFVLGLDGQGPECFDQVADFVERSGLYEVQITVQTPFPGTPLYGRLMSEGRVIDPERWEVCTLFDVNFLPTDMTPEALRRGLHDLSRRLYGAEAVARRRERYFRRLRGARRTRANSSRAPLVRRRA
ncbi:MAG: B12-binding domain-containing radical SAM protein [Planctomycetes bacterium]|nr:B12-binding domain-containing radical SAM protein [Planctomycetota bacterium]MCB9905502.1 B12-binding domain-containing radical SAM protein [Planctomycetota bacterium]